MKKILISGLYIMMLTLMIYNISFFTADPILAYKYEGDVKAKDASGSGQTEITEMHGCILNLGTAIVISDTPGSPPSAAQIRSVCTSSAVQKCSSLNIKGSPSEGVAFFNSSGNVIQYSTGFNGNAGTNPTGNPNEYEIICTNTCCEKVLTQ